MLPIRNDFLPHCNEGIAICGVYVPDRDSVHVGILWNHNHEIKIIEFNATNNVIHLDAAHARYQNFYFSPITDFPQFSLPFFAALSDLIATNRLNGLQLNIENAIYNGGKFSLLTGNHITKSGAEKFINCGVFVMSLLKTFNYNLVDLDSFPVAIPGQRNYLDDWLNANHVPLLERDNYYNQAKEIRGKHILASQLTATKPSPYIEINPLAANLIAFLAAANVVK